MAGWITRNWRLKLLALLLAVVGWGGVVLATNPPGTRSVSIPVPQPGSPNVSLPAGYLLTQPISNLTVDITGTQDHLNSFSKSSLQVSVDYSVIAKVGDRVPATVRLPVSIHNSDRNIQLDSPPTSVEANVDTSQSKTEGVEVAVSHTPPPGYVVATTVTNPPTVTVTGPEHELAGIQIRTEPINLANQIANFVATVDVYPYDSQGRPLSDVNVSPPSVNVQITVSAVDSSRTSAVTVGAVTGLAAGYQVTSVTYSPLTVTLTGSQTLLNSSSLATVATGGIDLKGQAGTLTYHVGLQVPSGITASPSSVSVTLTVTLIPTPTPSAAPTPTGG